MPPANSPARISSPSHTNQDQAPRSRPRPGAPPPYFSALRDLEEPVNQEVLRLAETLRMQTEERDLEADGEGAREGMRDGVPRSGSDAASSRAPRQSQSQSQERRELREQRLDQEQRNRLRRVMNRLSRVHESPAAYGDRIPSHNNLYDWSPANEADADDEDELDNILAELRRDQPAATSTTATTAGHPMTTPIGWLSGRATDGRDPELRQITDLMESASYRRLASETQNQVRAAQMARVFERHMAHETQQQQARSQLQPPPPPPPPPPPDTADAAPRSTATPQSMRRHPRLSAQMRGFIQRPAAERDSASRSLLPSELRERYAASEARQAALNRLAERRLSLEREQQRDRDMVSRVETFRRSYLDRSSAQPPSVSPLVEETIKYLSRIRYSNSAEDSIDYALDAGFLDKDYFRDSTYSLLLDTASLPPPAQTSWLAPGAVLSGCQHATTVTSTVTSAATQGSGSLFRLREDSAVPSLFDPGRGHQYTPLSYDRRPTPSAPETVTSHAPQQDRWPVKVTIHAVDYSLMTLAATMEAYDVPSHPHSHQSLLNPAQNLDSTPSRVTRTSSITTFLEGEILDFNTHTLLTESFKSNAGNDAMYWRKLPCFQKYTDEELVRHLTSQKFYDEVLCRDWVLMRWKERCFVRSLGRGRSTARRSPAIGEVQEAERMVVEEDGYGTGSGWSGSRNAPSTTRSRSGTPHVPYAYEFTDASGIPVPSFRDIPPQPNLTATSPSPPNPAIAPTNLDTDSSCGLTISGFYYTCLRRSDGMLEGLYYDPQSSPYQCLKLESVNGGVFPKWDVR